MMKLESLLKDAMVFVEEAEVTIGDLESEVTMLKNHLRDALGELSWLKQNFGIEEKP